jgi:hypothetical protein
MTKTAPITKDELRKVVREEINKSLDIKLDQKFNDFKEEMDVKFTEHRSYLVGKLDRILKEILASREEQTVLSGQVSDHDNRITALESTHS